MAPKLLIMADSWDLLHETMMKVNNVLGDYWMGDIEDDNNVETNEFSSEFGNSVSEASGSVLAGFSDLGDPSDGLHLPDPVTSDHGSALSELMSDCQSQSPEDAGMSECPGHEDAEADMEPWPPQPRARSNTWPRRQFGQMSQVIVTRDTGQTSGVSHDQSISP